MWKSDELSVRQTLLSSTWPEMSPLIIMSVVEIYSVACHRWLHNIELTWERWHILKMMLYRSVIIIWLAICKSWINGIRQKYVSHVVSVQRFQVWELIKIIRWVSEQFHSTAPHLTKFDIRSELPGMKRWLILKLNPLIVSWFSLCSNYWDATIQALPRISLEWELLSDVCIKTCGIL